MKNKLPQDFLDRIKGQLTDEYSEFLASYDKEPKKGIRINTLKTDPDEMKKRAPFKMEPVPWVKNGYFVDEKDDPAGHPFYRAGLYYIQEPSAMTPADRLDVIPGDRVLDLCAAPGGKATALAAKLSGEGLLVANDASASRCRALVHNLELFGARNIIVTNELPQNLEKKFPAFFDKIMVDAPCSGEGMFRKEPAVIDTWSSQRVEFFAKQQRGILKSAAAMLKDGGLMLYSTCTFSPQENEGSVSFVLEECPELELLEIEPYSGFSHGMPESGNGDEGLKKTVRIWPHKMDGEGHFMALFRKGRDTCAPEAEQEFYPGPKAGNRKKKKPGKKHKGGVNGFNMTFSAEEKKIMDGFLEGAGDGIDRSRLENKNGKVYLMPELPDDFPNLKILRAGLYMGELKKNRFEPSQSFAVSVYGNGFKNSFSMDETDPRLFAYFKGESIKLSDEEEALLRDGMILIKVRDFAVGFGKKTKEVIRSRYLQLK
jgi:NOL1/NOP2/sun family putative RNA methylase